MKYDLANQGHEQLELDQLHEEEVQRSKNLKRQSDLIRISNEISKPDDLLTYCWL
jgi:hypothetical protein